MIRPFPTGVGIYLDNIAYNLFLIDDTNTYIVLHNDLVVIKKLKSKYLNLKNVSIHQVKLLPSLKTGASALLMAYSSIDL